MNSEVCDSVRFLPNRLGRALRPLHASKNPWVEKLVGFRLHAGNSPRNNMSKCPDSHYTHESGLSLGLSKARGSNGPLANPILGAWCSVQIQGSHAFNAPLCSARWVHGENALIRYWNHTRKRLQITLSILLYSTFVIYRAVLPLMLLFVVPKLLISSATGV